MTTVQMWITILIVGFATMLTRFLPFVLFPGGKKVPAFVSYLGRVLPYAAMGLLVVYCLKGVPTSPVYGMPELLGVAAVALLHIWKGNTFLSIGLGTVFYMFLVQAVF